MNEQSLDPNNLVAVLNTEFDTYTLHLVTSVGKGNFWASSLKVYLTLSKHRTGSRGTKQEAVDLAERNGYTVVNADTDFEAGAVLSSTQKACVFTSLTRQQFKQGEN